MRKFAAMFMLLLPLALSGSGAFAADTVPQDSSPQDDDLGVSEELKKEGEKKKVIKKEDLPPIDMVFVKGG